MFSASPGSVPVAGWLALLALLAAAVATEAVSYNSPGYKTDHVTFYRTYKEAGHET
jgi:hypothetical protein